MRAQRCARAGLGSPVRQVRRRTVDSPIGQSGEGAPTPLALAVTPRCPRASSPLGFPLGSRALCGTGQSSCSIPPPSVAADPSKRVIATPATSQPATWDFSPWKSGSAACPWDGVSRHGFKARRVIEYRVGRPTHRPPSPITARSGPRVKPMRRDGWAESSVVMLNGNDKTAGRSGPGALRVDC